MQYDGCQYYNGCGLFHVGKPDYVAGHTDPKTQKPYVLHSDEWHEMNEKISQVISHDKKFLNKQGSWGVGRVTATKNFKPSKEGKVYWETYCLPKLKALKNKCETLQEFDIDATFDYQVPCTKVKHPKGSIGGASP